MDKKKLTEKTAIHNLKAETREIYGRKVKKLRKDGFVPANIFGKKIKSKAITIPTKDFQEVYKETGETGLVEILIKGEKTPALVHHVQTNAKSGQIMHVDFLQVDLKEKVEARVPVEIAGESPAEKQSIGTVVQHLNEVIVEALPMDLPEKFEIDASGLIEVDQTVYIKDLKVDKSKVDIKNSPEEIVAKVEAPQKIVEETPAPVEGETSGEEAPSAEPPVSDSNTETEAEPSKQ